MIYLGNFLHVNLTQSILSHLCFHFQFITGDKWVPYYEKPNFLVSSTMGVLVLLFKGGIAISFHLLFSCFSVSPNAKTEASDKVTPFCLLISKVWLVFEHRCVIWLIFTILIVSSIKILMWLLLLLTLALFSSYFCSLKLILLQCSYVIALGFVLPVTALIISVTPVDLLKVPFCFKITASS